MKAKLFRKVPFARTGQQTYMASELGMTGDAMVTVDRPAVAVQASAESFNGVPVTIDHPPALMDSQAVQRDAVGLVSEVTFDGATGQLKGDLLVWDAKAIRAIAQGTRELSAGYTAEYRADGSRYRQESVVGNHIALVKHGRAGSAVRIG
ncbi:DUF2213 domain-containing protein [Spiribacter vilamensis]|uniref:Uncharacterized protein DUF2213 n=1 Tax=Spiribacter vilamensis TaxID=531306 RepID=A0A4Q8D0D4_9GAMM|nr:DUF2213 domain-containing protein [Spiribacter vilamensis]RZU98776.1 uncharacterized protein DUF2213 [Spiribacter vilamensis]TVO62203.1 DUF2213 domain-containing protein [Spiribacter vilamensis]